ncbi:MAG: hypothetical protein IT222_04130 [Crocinitomix sp.]|nr:hypothetical protein [Crocinitomix sp.]
MESKKANLIEELLAAKFEGGADVRGGGTPDKGVCQVCLGCVNHCAFCDCCTCGCTGCKCG